MVVKPQPMQFRVMYRVEPTDAMRTIDSMKVQDIETLHRAMVNLAGLKKPMADWDTFVAHGYVGGQVREYGKMFLGCMYDDKYEYKSQDNPARDVPAFFIKGLTPITNPLTTGRRQSICSSSFFDYKG